MVVPHGSVAPAGTPPANPTGNPVPPPPTTTSEPRGSQPWHGAAGTGRGSARDEAVPVQSPLPVPSPLPPGGLAPDADDGRGCDPGDSRLGHTSRPHGGCHARERFCSAAASGPRCSWRQGDGHAASAGCTALHPAVAHGHSDRCSPRRPLKATGKGAETRKGPAFATPAPDPRPATVCVPCHTRRQRSKSFLRHAGGYAWRRPPAVVGNPPVLPRSA